MDSDKERKINELKTRLFDPQTPDYAFFTKEEVMLLFGISESTLRQWAGTEKFPAPKSIGNFQFYPILGLKEYFNSVARVSRKEVADSMKFH